MKDKNKESLDRIIAEIKKEHPNSNIEFNDNQILTINGTKIEVSTLEIIDPKEKDDKKPGLDEKGNELKILFKTEDGYEIIAEVNQDNEIMLNKEGLEKAKLSEKIEIDKDENEIELSDGEEKDEMTKVKKRKDNPEKEEEDKKEKKKTQEDTSQKNQPKNLRRLNDEVIKLLVPNTRDTYGPMYLNSEGEIVGKNKTTKEMEKVRGISKIKGTSSNMNIHGTEDKEHEHVNAKSMYRIDSRPTTGFAVTRDGTEKGNMDLKYTIRRRGSNNIEDYAYVDLPLLASQGRVGTQVQIKDRTGVRQGLDQGEIDEVYDEIDEIKIPEDIENEFDAQLKDEENGVTSLEKLKELLTKALVESRGIREVTARQIAEDMIDNNKSFEDADKDLREQEEKEDEIWGRDPRQH